MPGVEKDYLNSSFDQLGSEVKNTQSAKNLEHAKDEIEKRETPMNSAEVREYYDGAPSGERYKFSTSLARRAMLDVENARRESAGELRLSLGSPIRLSSNSLREIPEGGLALSGDGTFGTPEVYYKQITRGEGNWLAGKRQVETDEVVVVMRLNNNTGANEEGTVICGIAKQHAGVIDFDSASNVFWNMTEAQYTRSMGENRQTLLSGNQDGLNKRAFTGQLTSEQFHKEYKSQNRRTLYQDMDAWDKSRGNKRETWKYEEVKKETLDRVNNDYGELLQEAERRTEEIAKATEEALRTNRDEIKRKVTDPIFKNYMFLNQNGFLDRDPELKKRYGYILKDQLGIDPQALELYEAQYKKEQEEKKKDETIEARTKRVIEEAQAKAEEMVQRARDTATKAIEQTRAEAEKARRELEERAKKAREEFERQAEEARKQAEAKVAETRKELDLAKARIEEEAKRADLLKNQLEQAGTENKKQKDRSDRLEAQIQELQASIALLKADQERERLVDEREAKRKADLEAFKQRRKQEDEEDAGY